MTDKVVNSVWESEVVQGWQSESSGGGGWICRVNIQLGYKVFARGYSNEESFFPADMNIEGSTEQAKAKAKAFVDKVNAELPAGENKVKNPTNAIWLEIEKDSVYNKDVSTWEGNRIFVTPVWTDAYNKVILPALKESGAGLGWQWARVSFATDPYKATRMNQNGEEVANLVAYVA
jgi:hypothetical protein